MLILLSYHLTECTKLIQFVANNNNTHNKVPDNRHIFMCVYFTYIVLYLVRHNIIGKYQDML